MIEVVNKLNPDAAPAKTAEGWLDVLLEPAGITFEELKEKVIIWPEFHYKKYEKSMLRGDGEPGFNTWNGKVDLTILPWQDFPGGYDRPYYEEPRESPYTTPELYKEYPLILMTGSRSYEFFHSEHRNLPTMREFHPEPLVMIHPEMAKELDISEGNWCWIENMRGRCRQKATLTKAVHPKMAHAEHGWWKPENDPETLYDMFDYNINNLTTQCDVGKSGYGAAYGGFPCKIYKVTPENSEISPTEQVLKLGGFKYERKCL